MPVKILLADKSITIQKVVEMLFSGKEYEVLCVSDGETALSEASRVVPDVVLADIDLPRIDGYTFSARLKQVPALAQTPVILMMSRDDVFDDAKARQASIVDRIAKPFESQELIGKVKKAIAAAPPKLAGSVPAAPQQAAAPLKTQVPPPTPPRTAAAVVPSPQAAPKAKPKQAPDIFDIIEEAPSQADFNKSGVRFGAEENTYEVEPVIEVEEPIVRDVMNALPVGKKAVEEMREGLGLTGRPEQSEQEIVSFESLDMAMSTAQEYIPPRQEGLRRPEPKPYMPPMREAREYIPPPPDSEDVLPAEALPKASQQPRVSEEMVRSMVEEQVSRIVSKIARDVIEKVAWEVVPDLAAMLIKEEIERLKAEQ